MFSYSKMFLIFMIIRKNTQPMIINMVMPPLHSAACYSTLRAWEVSQWVNVLGCSFTTNFQARWNQNIEVCSGARFERYFKKKIIWSNRFLNKLKFFHCFLGIYLSLSDFNVFYLFLKNVLFNCNLILGHFWRVSNFDLFEPYLVFTLINDLISWGQ